MTIYRPGHHLIIPGVRVVQPGGGAAVIPWYLSGGIAAANCLAAYTPKGAASLVASYDNNAAPGNGLPDGTYDAAPGVAPTFDAATGWTFNGSTQWLTTGVVPVNNQTWSVIVRLADRANNSSPARTGDPRFGFYMDGSSVYYYNGGLSFVGPQLVSGIVAVVGNTAYRNGISEGLTIPSAAGVMSNPVLLGAATGPALLFNGKIVAAAIYNVTITPAQVAAVSAAMAAL